jgi:NADH-quinone oxidoreductase subunit H
MIIPEHLGPLNIALILPYFALVCVMGFVLLLVPGLVWLERVFMALMQDRLGPNRVGPRGLIQPIADGIKLFFKEDILPANVDIIIYYLAPIMVIMPALAAGATIPFSMAKIRMDNGIIAPVPVVVGDVNIGILYILALTSLQVYGIVLAGWSSNNKYSLIGGLRSSAQVISYELAMSLAILTAVFISHSLNLVNVVHNQSGYWLGFIPKWNVFQFYGLGAIAACIYLIAMVAETNRAPFDLPEAESELVAGFHTEYSSMKFAIFFMGEYASMIIVSSIATVLWFGGWNPLFPFLAFIPGWIWFIGKLMTMILIYIWVRTTLPRLRYDALMSLGWKRMLPVALIVLFLVAVVDTIRTPDTITQSAASITKTSSIGWTYTHHSSDLR